LGTEPLIDISTIPKNHYKYNVSPYFYYNAREIMFQLGILIVALVLVKYLFYILNNTKIYYNITKRFEVIKILA